MLLHLARARPLLVFVNQPEIRLDWLEVVEKTLRDAI